MSTGVKKVVTGLILFAIGLFFVIDFALLGYLGDIYVLELLATPVLLIYSPIVIRQGESLLSAGNSARKYTYPVFWTVFTLILLMVLAWLAFMASLVGALSNI